MSTGAVGGRSTLSSSPVTDRRLAMLLMALFAATWAVLEEELGARLRQPYDLTQVVWCRYASHLLLVCLIWGLRGPSRLWRTSRRGLQVGRSVLMLIMPLSFAAGVGSGTAPASVWAMFWCAPLLILVFARFVLDEQTPAWVWMLTVTASLGAVAIIRPPAVTPTAALLWPVGMASSFALYTVLTRELRHEPLSANLFYTAVAVFVPLSFYVPRIWVTPSTHDAVILFLIGALGLLALFALDRAAERAEVSLTAAFLTLQVAAVLFIHWSRQTAFAGKLTFVGLILVLTSLAVLWARASRRAAVPPP